MFQKQRWFLLAHLFVVFLVFLAPDNAVWAKTQRMGVPAGTHSVDPHSSKKVNSYCMDSARPAPSSKDVQNYVLYGFANVFYDGKTLPLQEAIDKGIIAVRGTNNNFDEGLFQIWLVHLSEKDPLIKELLSPEIPPPLRNDIEVFLRNTFRQRITEIGGWGGDHRQIELVNPTDKLVKVDFTGPVIFGGKKEGTNGLDPDLIKAAADPKEQENNQERIWRSQRQNNLKELGYLDKDFPVEGKESGTYDKALEEFQQMYNLPADDVDHHLLDSKLEEVQQNETRIGQTNQGEDGNFVVGVEHPLGHPSQWIISFGSGKPPIKGNNLSELVSLVNERNKDVLLKKQTIYFESYGLSPNKFEAFERSYRIHQNMINPHIKMVLSSEMELKPSKQENHEPDLVKEGENKGWFKKVVSFISNVAGKFTVKSSFEIYGRTKKAVKDAVEALYNAVGKNNGRLVMEKLANEIYSEISAKIYGYRVTEKSLNQLSTVLGSSSTKDFSYILANLKGKVFEKEADLESALLAENLISDDIQKILQSIEQITGKNAVELRIRSEFQRLNLGNLFRWRWIFKQVS